MLRPNTQTTIVEYQHKTKPARCQKCRTEIADGSLVYAYTDTHSHFTRYEHVNCPCHRSGSQENAPHDFGWQAEHGLGFEIRARFNEGRDSIRLQNEMRGHGWEVTDYGYHSEVFGSLRNSQNLRNLWESIPGSQWVTISVTVYGGYTQTTAQWLLDNRLFELLDGVRSVEVDGNVVEFRAQINSWDSFRRLYLVAREATDTFNKKVAAWGYSEKTRAKIAGTWAAKVNEKVQKLLEKAPSYKG